MAIPISELKRSKDMGPPRTLIYGLPGMAKTSLASEFPDHICIQTEDGKPKDVELNSFGIIDTFAGVMDQLNEVYSAEHEYGTLIVDSLTELKRQIHAETCARGDENGHTKAQIDDFGFGKGYTRALTLWQEFLEGLRAIRRDRGMAIVLIGHANIVRFDDPENVAYDRYEIDLQHSEKVSARALIENEMDAILLLKSPVTISKPEKGFDKNRAIGTGRNSNIVIHTVGTPAYTAKNRYGMPDKIPFIRGKGFSALAPYFQGDALAPINNADQSEA